MRCKRSRNAWSRAVEGQQLRSTNLDSLRAAGQLRDLFSDHFAECEAALLESLRRGQVEFPAGRLDAKCPFSLRGQQK